MNLEELQNLFGTTEGFIYRVVKNKSQFEILQDLDTILYTLDTTQGFYIRTLQEVSHSDYVRITE